MDFKTINCLPKFKEELPPINRPNLSANSRIIKNYRELNKPVESLNKIDPLILVTQYEREIDRIKINHSEMLKELHRELEILRSKNRDLLDELIVMNGGNYCCKHLENLSYDILKSDASDNQKPLSDILYNAKICRISTENDKNHNYKHELPELITIGSKCMSKDVENKSNSLLQEKLSNCNKLIDVLRRENVQQKSELTSLNCLLNNGLNISGVGLNSGLIRKSLKSSKKCHSLSHPTISYLDIISSKDNLQSVSGNE